MALFGKRAPSLFELPYDLREDIRAAIDRAPQDAVLRMRTPGAERSLEALNKRSPAQEVISAMVYCVNALTFAKGYLAVGQTSLIVSITPDEGNAKLLAIPFADISRFWFDNGMAWVRFGDPERRVDIAFPGGGPHCQAVCGQIKATVDSLRADPYSL